jgi:VWFA-related protein
MILLPALERGRDAKMKLSATLALAALCASSALSAQTFRTAVNVVRIDVSVTDRNGAPVNDLTQDDFRILEDGNPANIVAFQAVNIPVPMPPPPGQASWVTENRHDVVSNRVEDRRVIMIVMDDASMPYSVHMIDDAKRIGHDIVAKLGEADRAAVVFTNNTKFSQDFTTDKSRLNAAIEGMSGGKVLTSPESQVFDQFYYKAASRTLSSAIELLKTTPQGRKAVVFISPGVPISPEDAQARAISATGGSLAAHDSALTMQEEVRSALSGAELSQVAVYAFSPGGVGALEDYVTDFLSRHGTPIDQAMKAGHDYANFSTDFLEGEAAASGGLAVVGTNSYAAGINRMFGNLSSFYLIGFASAASKDGKHSLSVLTQHPDYKVQARSNFRINPPDKNADKISDATPPKGTGLTKAMSAALPEGNLPLRVAAEPFMGVGDQHPVAIALGIHQPKTAGAASTSVTLKVNAYSPEGTFVIGRKLDAKLVLRPTSDDALQYEVLSSLRLKPGRYQLRLGAEIAESGLSGSVFADVDVPDFVKDPISMSGLALSMTPAMTAAPKDAFKDIAPLFTAHRSFGVENQVSVLARIYQGGKAAPASVRMAARVMDVRDRRVYSRSESIAADQFKSRAADYVVDIPLVTLDPGEYLLAVEATLPNGKIARRDLRFTRR